MSYLIGYSYEKIKKYDEKIIDNVLDNFSFWKNIKCQQELSTIEKFKQFRSLLEFETDRNASSIQKKADGEQK